MSCHASTVFVVGELMRRMRATKAVVGDGVGLRPDKNNGVNLLVKAPTPGKGRRLCTLHLRTHTGTSKPAGRQP